MYREVPQQLLKEVPRMDLHLNHPVSQHEKEEVLTV